MSPRILAALMGLAALPAQAERQQVTALSLAAPEIVAATASGNGASTLPALFVASASATVLSADGARLAFTTVATDLLAGVDDANGTGDVYVLDRASGTISYGNVPPYSVVVPGSLPSQSGGPSLACAVIVKRVDEKTRSKTSINDLLRD